MSCCFNNKIYCLPYYYDDITTVTNRDYEIARNSWNLIISGESTIYIFLKTKNTIGDISSIALFCNLFITNIEKKDLTIKGFFFNSRIHIKQKTLIYMIKLMLNNWDNPVTFYEQIAKSHNKRNIKSHHYFIFGEVLIETIQEYLSLECYDEIIEAWTKIYNNVLRFILPYTDI